MVANGTMTGNKSVNGWSTSGADICKKADNEANYSTAKVMKNKFYEISKAENPR